VDLSSLIARNAAFTPDKPALHFESETLSYAALSTRIAHAASALRSKFGVRPGDRVAILSLNRPDYLVLLYACARLGAILVPMNWRLAVAEQMFILTDASPKVLVLEHAFAPVLPALAERLSETRIVGLDFMPERGVTFDALLAHDDESVPDKADLSCPLLIVYTSGTTGRPKGAVLRQEALLWNGVMSQHMHGLTSDDHVLTVLPLFHVGGLNIQTTPALHHGATVTLHARFTPDATLAAMAWGRRPAPPPDADGAGACDHSGRDRTSCLGRHRSLVPQGDLHRLDYRAARADRPHHGAQCAGAASLWLD
jgi:fatty-acyl-CoA synthase